VDGIHYEIEEPRPFSKKNSSFKYGGKAALAYEFCLCTYKPKMTWLNGPFFASDKDDTTFKTKGLKSAIEKKQRERNNDFRIIADDGYVDQANLDTLALRNELDPPEIQWYKDRALSRHERFNGLTKNYKCLTEKFRHDRGDNPNGDHPMHKACVEAICVTIQYELDEGLTTLFDPYPT